MIQGKKIFITGGAGFIASHLIPRLIENNKVVVYDNGHRNAIQYTSLESHPNLTFIKGDVLDEELLQKSIADSNYVVHMAAIAGVSSYYKMPLKTMKVNFLGTYNVLEAIKNLNVELYIDFSTSEIYGAHAQKVSELDNTVQGRIDDRRWVYSISKLASEKLGYCYHWEHGLPVATVRPFNVYGPGQVGEGVISNFARAATQNETIQVTGDGKQRRSMCYVSDFIDGMMLLMANPKKAAGKSFNIGNSDCEASVLEMAETVIRVSGSKSKIEFIPHPGSDVIDRSPSVLRMKEEFSYQPKVNLEDGVRHCVKWFADHA